MVKKKNTFDVKVKIYLLFLMLQEHVSKLSRCFTVSGVVI